jgi:hypothetical protein
MARIPQVRRREHEGFSAWRAWETSATVGAHTIRPGEKVSVLTLVSGQAFPSHAAETEEFVHTIATYFRGAALYADEFGPVSHFH